MKTFLRTRFFDTKRKSNNSITIYLIVTILLLQGFHSNSAPIFTQPNNFPSTCVPTTNTSFTHSTAFSVNNNNFCGNNGDFNSFRWEYNNGGTWITVVNNTPAGFVTYAFTGVQTGSGNSKIGTTRLTLTVSSAVAPGTYQFRGVVINSACPGTPFVSNVITFTVNPLSTPTFITQPSGSGCVNTNYTYTTQAGFGNTYLWGLPGAAGTDYTIVSGGSTSDNTLTIRWLTPSSKVITVNYATAAGCSAASPGASSSGIIINALPTPSFSTLPVGPLCTATNYTYTTQGSQSNYSWTYSGTSGIDYNIISGGNTSSNTVALQWLTAGDKTVNINYTNAAGCTASTATSTTATVVARPTPTFAPVPAASVCVGNSITYTTQSSQSNYVWTVPGALGTDYTISSGSLSNTSNTVTLIWLTAGSKTVTVNYSNGSGCTSLTAAFTTTTVNPRPSVTFSPVPPTTSCPNVDVVYTTQAGQSNYIWNVPGTLGSDYTITAGGIGTTSNSVTIRWLTSGNKVVTINYNNSNGCTAASATSHTTLIYSRPSPTFTTAPDPIICVGTNVTYTTQASQSNYAWAIPGVLNTDFIIVSGSIGSTSNTVTIEWLTAGSKSVSVNYSNSDGCNALNPATNTTNVSAAPVPVVSGGPLSFCDGGSVTLSSTSATTYQWFNNGTLIPGATSQTYVANSSATYTVRTTNVNGCFATSTGTVVTENPLPDITLSTQASSLCFSASAQTSQLTYTNTDNSPNTYSITWSAAAVSAGFVNIVDAALPASPITINVPANATGNTTFTGSITVKTINNCVSSSKPFSVSITSQPNVTNFALTAANGCVGTGNTVTVNSSSLLAGTYTVTYNLSGANTSTGNTATLTSNGSTGTFIAGAAVNAGATTITVTQISVVGCNSAVTSNNTGSFTIYSLPSVAAITGPSSVCAQATIDLDNATAGGTWFTSEPSIASVNVTTGVVTGLLAGSATITYTTAPTNGCTNSTSSSIIVYAIPSVSPITGVTSFCINSSTDLDNATAGGAWTSSNTAIATVNSTGLVSAVAAGTSTITYTTAANANGCTNSTSVLITVDALPTVFTGSQIEACESATPSPITLTSSGFGGSATAAFWSIPAGSGTLSNQGSGNSPSTVTYTPAANFNGTVILSLTTNSPNSCAAVSETRVINITEKPVVIAGSSVSICESPSPLPITLAGASVGGGSTTAAWSVSPAVGTLSSTAYTTAPASVTYTPQANYFGTVTLTLTSDAPGACSPVIATKSVVISQLPTVNSGADLTACQSGTPTSITLSGATFGGGATTAAWSIVSGGGTLSNTSQTNTPTAVTYTPAPNYAGLVVIRLTTNPPGGCGAISDDRQIEISPASIVNAGGPNSICQSATPTAIALTGARVSGGATTGAWSINSGGGTLSSTSATANPELVTYTPPANFTGTVTLSLTSNATSPCSGVSATRTINVTVPPSATAGGNLSTCENSGAVNITSGAIVSGNFTGTSWSSSGSGTFTNVSSLTAATYTPSVADIAAGSVTITLTAIGGACANATSSKILTITKAATADAGSSITICSDAGATNITAGASAAFYSTIAWTSSGTGTIADPSSLTNATYTPGPGESGTITLTLTATGNSPCGNTLATKSLIITPLPVATFSYTGSPYCSNAANPLPTYSGGGTAGGFTSTAGLVFLNSATGQINISASTPGTYTVTNTIPPANSCGEVSSTSTITITALPVATFSYASPFCQTDPNPVPTFSGNGVAGNFSSSAGLVFANASTGEINLSVSTPGTYTITNTIAAANGCGVVSATSSITIRANSTINLTSGNNSQTKCINTPIENIMYAIGGGGTNATVTGLPAGLTGTYNSGVFTISGSATVAGTFNFTVTTVGPCTNPNLTGTLIIDDNATITLSSAAGSNIQTKCINTAITDITYAIGGGGTGATVAGLPPGVLGNFNSGIYTISGIPTIAGTYNYIVSTTGPCVKPTLGGTITVQPNSTLSLTSASGTDAQARCINTALTPITYLVASGGTSASMTAGALPAGVTGSYDNTSKVFTISGTPTVAGTYTYSITTAGPCINVTETGTINVDPISKAGDVAISGATAPGNVRTICPSPNSVTLTMTGAVVGNISRWDYSTNGGVSWTPVAKTTATITEDDLPQTRSYRAVVLSGVCSEAYSDTVIVDVIPPYPPTPVTASPSTVCLGQSSVLTAATGYPTSGIPAEDGNFNQGDDRGWVQDCQLHQSASGDNTNVPVWTKTNDHPFLNNIVWDSRQLKFTIVNGPGISSLESPLFSLIGQTNATLNFIQAFHLFAGASGTIDISTNGNAPCNDRIWTNLKTYTGSGSNPTYIGGGNYSPQPFSFGQPTAFQPVNINLNAYIGLSNLRIRFRYNGGGTAWSTWALDGLSTPGTALPISYVWSGNILNSTTGIPVTATPQVIGANTYNIATTIGGCPGGNSSVTIMVSDTPSIAPPTTTAVCFSTSAQTSQLSYTGGSGNLSTYSIAWTGAASTLFAAVNDADLPGDPGVASGTINIAVPANVPAGTYTGTLTVENAANCASSVRAFTLEVNPRPAAVPTGTVICFSSSNQTVTVPLSSQQNAPTEYTITWNSTLAAIPYTSIVDNNASVTVPGNTPAGTYTGTLFVRNAFGCVSATGETFTIVINAPVAITAQPSTSPVCLHFPATISTTVTGTNPTFAWEVNDGVNGWQPATGPNYTGANTADLTIVNPQIQMLFYTFRNNVGSTGPCNSAAVSNISDLKIRNVWLGTVDDNWQNGNNWSDGVTPSPICDTTHILDRVRQPILSYGTSTNTNLLIYSGADMTLTNQPNTYIEVAASIVNNNIVPGINALDGRLVMNGTLQAQASLKGSLFTQHILNFLTISNTTAGGVSIDPTSDPLDTLYISNHLNFGPVNSRTFNTNDRLTLLSRSNLTASVGDLTNGGANTLNVINGRVTVERWFAQRKAWRFLSVPTLGPQTFRSAWQEKMLVPNDNRFPGYGTTITIGTGGSFAANGFDADDITGPSVKTYAPLTNTYVGISNSAQDMTSNRGYFTFVRGNRSSTTFTSPVTSTVLRTNGPLIQGIRPGVSVGSVFASVANPYASPIDMRKIDKPGAQEFFYLWNPNMSGRYGLGAFQTYSISTVNGQDYYAPVPDDGTAVDNFIQSGQAFFVAGFTTAGNGMVNIEESDKEFQSNMIFRTQGMPEDLKVNLSISADNSSTVVDGMRVDFSDSWSNAVDRFDAHKLTNISENVASLRENTFLAIERRKTIADTDTIFVNMSGLRVTPNYKWSIIMNNMDSAGRSAFLIDSYLNTRTPLALNDTTEYKFAVQNIPGSYNQRRFTIVFKQLAAPAPPAPVLITSISASRNYDNSIAVDWKVENETNVQGYTIERSADGTNFTGIITKDAGANNGGVANFAANDLSPLAEDNFYRVRALLQNGQVVYSQIVKVEPLAITAGITIFPNPVKNKTLHIKFAGQLKGNYSIVLNNKLGQVMHQSTAAVNNSVTSVDIRLKTYVTPGAYQLLIISPSGEATKQQVIIE